MQAAQEELSARKLFVAIVSFAAPERLAVYQKIHRWPFPILADPDRSAYRQFELERLPWRRVFAPATLRFYARMLLRGKKIENYGRDDYRQSGGDFIVDANGKVVFAHRSHEPSDRPSVKELLAAIEQEIA